MTSRANSEIGEFGSKLEFAGAAIDSALERALPSKGRDWLDIEGDLIARKSRDFDWRAGRVSIYVYHDNEELLRISRDAHNLFFSENALGKRAFPSLASLESEVLSMCMGLFQAPRGATGSFTSGGTESVFLAIKAARDCHRSKRGSRGRCNLVVPVTAHPVFDKAASYLDVDVIRVGIDEKFRCDTSRLKEALSEQTILIAGSAPCYPFGVFDPIVEIAEIAMAADIWFHVDACLGGFLAPFAREEGWPIPEFELSVPGVTSLSVDLHKFGLTARGASVILYRSTSFHAFQGFCFDNWPRGSYSTETFLGSRAGGPVASAWAVLQYLGHSGYRRLANKIMDAKSRLVAGIEAINGLEVVRPSELNIVIYKSNTRTVDINAVADTLEDAGWYVGRSREPLGIHFAVNAVHAPIIEQYLMSLSAAVEHVRSTARRGDSVEFTY